MTPDIHLQIYTEKWTFDCN